MIPKIIHYCWFGKTKKNSLIKICIKSWNEYFKDYKIIEWNEENFDLSNVPDFVKDAYHKKKWAFVSDYVRLSVLKKYGGIYLDTDVEVISSFEKVELYNFFCCFESEGYICTAVLGCDKENNIISKFLMTYEDKKFNQIPNSKLLYEFLFENKTLCINKSIYISPNEVVLSNTYFSPKNFYTKKINITKDTLAIHHFDGTWKSSKHKFKDKFIFLLTKLFGENIIKKIKGILKK